MTYLSKFVSTHPQLHFKNNYVHLATFLQKLLCTNISLHLKNKYLTVPQGCEVTFQKDDYTAINKATPVPKSATMEMNIRGELQYDQ